ncbi:DiGeorge syndrome critical region protein 14 [Quaeritorhiza haematococci]|nr:DiGeorge syndrome critical region protein 14 [Quaeritorhiza haematococci]
MSLDAFQSLYTSEDNASFSVIMQKAREEKRQKYKWVFDKEKKQMLLKAEAEVDESGKEGGKGEEGGEGEEGKVMLLLEPPERLVATVEDWKYKAKNELMYYPEGAPLTLKDLGESRGPPKAISHSATRFPTTTSTKEVLSSSQSAAERLRTQEVWKEMAKATPALFNPSATPSSSTQAGEAPRINGYGFVAATPSPAPHRDIDPSELMTWGFIEGTPLLMGSGADQTPGPSFKIPPTPKREEIGLKLSEMASKNLRKRATGKESFVGVGGGTTPGVGTPRLTPTLGRSGAAFGAVGGSGGKRLASPAVGNRMLSPAAQQLLQRSKMGSSSSGLRRGSGSASGFDTQLRESYSRSSGGGSVKRIGTGSSSVSSSFGATPSVYRMASPVVAGRKSGGGSNSGVRFEGVKRKGESGEAATSITDNLLKL